MRVQVLGSGTSSGVPTLGCSCATCTSTDPRDRRLRPSVWICSENTSVIIDTSSDFRQQCIEAQVRHVDAVVYTHHHYDHIAGFDDLRAYNYISGGPMPLYLMSETLQHMQRIFDYAFFANPNNQSSRPLVEPHEIGTDQFKIDDLTFTPLPLKHGDMSVLGYRVGDFAYCTDCNYVTDLALSRLEGIDTLILDALRYKAHPTHFSLDAALSVARTINARRTYFTHIAHDLRHDVVSRQLPDGVELAYDGLTLEFS